MERVNLSHKAVCDDGLEAPTVQTFTRSHLMEALPWETRHLGRGNHWHHVSVASAPVPDFFLSATVSPVCNMRLQKNAPSCHTMVGPLLVSMCVSSCQQLHTILVTVKDDTRLIEKIKTDLSGACWETSEKRYPKFWGGANARFVPSASDFKLIFIENKTKFEVAVGS
jgi:hypothetical protein